MPRYLARITLLVLVLLVSGCVSGTPVRQKELRRLDGVAPVPRDARIGMTEFAVCGESYQDKLSTDLRKRDEKAQFYRKCTEIGHPQTFSRLLQQRLEQRLGRKLVLLKPEKTFKPHLVVRDADKLGLDYVIAGDLFYLAEKDSKTLVSTALYVVRVPDRKVVMGGRVLREGPVGKVQQVIDEIADELFEKAFKE